MSTQGQSTTRSPARSTCASVAALLAIASSGAIGGVVFEPAPSNFENALLMLAGASMQSTVGPVSVEGDGVLRYTSGLYPPETIELNLPELRSASPLDALRWSNRWREIIESTFGGEREMVNYWEQGATVQGEPLFSVLRVGDDFLNSENGRTPSTALDDPRGPTGGVARAMAFARGGSGGSGGGGGGGSPFNPFASPANPQPTSPGAPIVDPGVLPPPNGGNDGSGDPTGEAPVETPTTQPPRFGLSFGEIEWVDPTFNRTPAPARPENGDGNPFDGEDGFAPNAPVAIPTPTAMGLGLGGLLAIGASSRRRRGAVV